MENPWRTEALAEGRRQPASLYPPVLVFVFCTLDCVLLAASLTLRFPPDVNRSWDFISWHKKDIPFWDVLFCLQSCDITDRPADQQLDGPNATSLTRALITPYAFVGNVSRQLNVRWFCDVPSSFSFHSPTECNKLITLFMFLNFFFFNKVPVYFCTHLFYTGLHFNGMCCVGETFMFLSRCR